MKEQELEDLGFKKTNDPFTKKQVWVLGKENVDICGEICALPVFYYNIEKQTIKIHRGEFSIIQRKCETIEDVRKFVECINFLFNKSFEIK